VKLVVQTPTTSWLNNYHNSLTFNHVVVGAINRRFAPSYNSEILKFNTSCVKNKAGI